MILTANLSDSLIELIRRKDAPIDGIEVGPWLGPPQILEYRKNYPRHPFYFHGADIANRIGLFSNSGERINRYLKATGSPWVSLHLTFFPPEERRLFFKLGVRMPIPYPDRSTRQFIKKVKALSRRIAVPIILENLDPLPISCNYEVQPDRITNILEGTGCGLLLDIGHARLSAEYLGVAPEEYILNLPMSGIVQVHVSGPRRRGEKLFDAHEPMQEVDYELLEFVLKRSHPRVVTLEYIREVDPLREQLIRLRRMMDRHP
jgi:uncharacterized protein (UPF0276 family)